MTQTHALSCHRQFVEFLTHGRSGEAEMFAVLRKYRLDKYLEVFIGAGCDCEEMLLEMEEEDVEGIIAATNMPSLHAKKFKKMMEEVANQ